MILNSSVKFGTSGVRGLVSEMTDAVCYAYTAAFLQTVAGTAHAVVMGHDLRPSSPKILAACAAAVEDSGREVIYVGALPTPAIAFYAAALNLPSLIITGSHIPFDRNGIKFYRATGEISKADEVAMLNAAVTLPAVIAAKPLPSPDLKASEAYIQRYLNFFGVGALTGLRLAIYEHSSVARDLLHQLLKALGAEVISLGRADVFVPIDTEAVRNEDIAQTKKWAAEQPFDAIFSTDGDADRPLIGDEQGHWLRGDMVGILCAQYLEADVVVTPVSSNTAVEQCGTFKRVIRTQIGSPYVIAGMESALAERANIVVGYEANGGFLLGSEVNRQGRHLAALPTRDAVLPMLALLCLAREKQCKLSELSNSLPKRFTHSDRIQDFPNKNSQLLISSLMTDTSAAQSLMALDAGTVSAINTTDGLRVIFSNGDIVHLRPSGNAPELRCYAESNSQERAQQLCLDCLRRITHSVVS